ncbi:MAG: AAA family ATPase, partial [Rhodospirillaceae bacterium]|nr:AAA family ATPase [Rhodospirillaceae bacterium]
MSDLIEKALEVAKEHPCFPTRNKKPALSNQQLGEILGREIKKGQGGFKIATQDPDLVRKLFEAAGTDEISVPLGLNGSDGEHPIVCIDADTYKSAEAQTWVDTNEDLLGQTRRHSTRSDGDHFIFLAPKGVKLPATLAPGIDLKGHGGYICWPGTPGYEVVHDVEPLPFPMELLEGTDNPKTGTVSNTGWNDATDAELIAAIQSAEDLYPALRTLAWRMSGDRSYSQAEAVEILDGIMDGSAAKNPHHIRNEDWMERGSKISDLVASAWEKHLYPLGSQSDMMLEMLGEVEKPLFDLGRAVAAPAAPKTPRPDIEVPDFKKSDKPLPPREWLYGHHMIRGFLTATVSAGGMGKSSLIIVEALSMASGRELLGVTVYEPIRVLYWCGEDPRDELQKRVEAAMDHHGLENADLGGRLFILSGRDMGLNLAYHDHQDAKLSDEDIAAIRKVIQDTVVVGGLLSVLLATTGAIAQSTGPLRAYYDEAPQC